MVYANREHMAESRSEMLARVRRFFDQEAERLGIVGGSPRVIIAATTMQLALSKIWNEDGGRPALVTWKVGLPLIREELRTAPSLIEALRRVDARMPLVATNDVARDEGFSRDKALRRWYKRALRSETKAPNPVR